MIGVLFFAFVQYAALGALIWCAYNYFGKVESAYWGKWLLISVIGFFVGTLIRYLYNQKILCPLCHGPMFGYRACQKHATAKRFPLLGYRARALFDMVTSGVFRCIYCGTLFRTRR